MAGGIARILIALAFVALPLRAVENVYSSSYNETTPTSSGGSSNIPNWTTGWIQPATEPAGYTYTTGWNYVGRVAGTGSQASGVYLGNNCVITCAHVGPGDFTLNGVTYAYVANSVQTFTATTGTATAQVDFVIFRISTAPALPVLPIRSSNPVVGGNQAAMIGYGDGDGLTNETWGYDTVNYGINEATDLFSYVSNDFWIANNSSSAPYQVVSGDSGGGDFIYNTSSNQWELAGLNEAILQNNSGENAGSACVQLNTYNSQITNTVTPPTDTPVLPPWGLVALGALLVGMAAPAILPGRR